MSTLSAHRYSWLLPLAFLVAAAFWGLAASWPYRTLESDLTQDYISARSWFDGGSIYASLSTHLAHPNNDPDRTRVNDHPPPYIVALSPLALFPFSIAHTLLAALSLVVLAGAGVLVAREMALNTNQSLLLVAVLLLHSGVRSCTVVGNTSLLLAGLIVLGWRALRRDCEIAAGVYIGLATAMKLYPGLLVVGFGAIGRFRAAVSAGITVVGVWAVSAALVGVDEIETYISIRAGENANREVTNPHNLSLAGAAHRHLRSPDHPQLVAAGVWGGRALVLTIVAVGFAWRRWETSPDTMFAMLIPAMLLLSPITWLHAVPMMVVPVAILIQSHPRKYRLPLMVVVAALYFSSHSDSLLGYTTILPIPTWGMLGVLVLAALPRCESTPAAAGSPPSVTPSS